MFKRFIQTNLNMMTATCSFKRFLLFFIILIEINHCEKIMVIFFKTLKLYSNFMIRRFILYIECHIPKSIIESFEFRPHCIYIGVLNEPICYFRI